MWGFLIGRPGRGNAMLDDVFFFFFSFIIIFWCRGLLGYMDDNVPCGCRLCVGLKLHADFFFFIFYRVVGCLSANFLVRMSTASSTVHHTFSDTISTSRVGRWCMAGILFMLVLTSINTLKIASALIAT